MARRVLFGLAMRIIIDAGHGGATRAGNSSAFGSRGAGGTLEKDVTLDIARQVVARLGGAAALTRTGDVNLSLGARASQAARDGANVFVSIHANYGAPEMTGAETWVHPEAGQGSHRLAGDIKRALDQISGRYGGSAESRRGMMAVLSPQVLGRRTSACLVEVDYLSNPRGEQRLGDPHERARIGAAIAGAIQQHLAHGLDDADPTSKQPRPPVYPGPGPSPMPGPAPDQRGDRRLNGSVHERITVFVPGGRSGDVTIHGTARWRDGSLTPRLGFRFFDDSNFSNHRIPDRFIDNLEWDTPVRFSQTWHVASGGGYGIEIWAQTSEPSCRVDLDYTITTP